MSGIWDKWRSDDGENRNSFTGDLQNRSEAFALSGGLSGFSDLKNDLFGGGGDEPSTFASDTFAALTRQQFADFMADIAPYEDKLIEFNNSTTAATDSMQRGLSNVKSSFDRQEEATAGRLKGLGLTLNADEQKASTRSTGLAKSLAEVHAANSAGQQTRSLQQSLLGSPVPNLGDLS